MLFYVVTLCLLVGGHLLSRGTHYIHVWNRDVRPRNFRQYVPPKPWYKRISKAPKYNSHDQIMTTTFVKTWKYTINSNKAVYDNSDHLSATQQIFIELYWFSPESDNKCEQRCCRSIPLCTQYKRFSWTKPTSRYELVILHRLPLW